MIDEASHDSESAPAPRAVPPRAASSDSVVIDGEATDISDPVETPKPEPTAAADAPPDEAASAAPPAADDPPPPVDDVPPAKRSSSGAFSFGLLGAIVGAVIGVVGALGVAWLLEPSADPLQAISQKQASLEASEAAQSQTAKTLAARLSALESGQAGVAKAAALDALDKRIAKLEASSITADALLAVQTEVRAARADAAKALAAAKGDGAPTPAATPSAGGADAGAPDPRVVKLEGDVAALTSRVAEIAALGDRVAKLEGALAAPKTETRVAPTDVAAKTDGAPEAILAIALEQRLRSGEPFSKEWAALSALGADAGALAALKPFSDSGAPTAESLGASFAKITPALLAAAHPDVEGGPMDKLLDHMRKMVRVRPVGEVAGEDPDALVSQVAAALARGDVGSALAAFGRLPEPVRKSAADWAKTAEARASADAAARVLREAAIGRLATTKN